MSPNHPTRILHTMLRVRDLDRALTFYCDCLGMRELRRLTFPDDKFTLAFLGYQPEATSAVIELTHNWGETKLTQGTQFGHLALGVSDFDAVTARLATHGVSYTRLPGPMKSISDDSRPSDNIAFIVDPDGNQIELIEQPRHKMSNTALIRRGSYWL